MKKRRSGDMHKEAETGRKRYKVTMGVSRPVRPE
jgi:hypothetical protein